ncbi:MAG: OprO/OprP family phosphate-selective porin [Flavobacteriales bacterium]|nr:OprO/OprP family phosphate-selective porin [Flavobacteriales bacterium]MCW8913823.1 OprO/OprP family phosphate-selective porin [Flavobacteriales bacterium]MCW8937939.1 OprO/OprP family phosphate-selective porin [Flavobacteriales bacterium]MCW8939701.1 OprO/OprP family phosphate-selective porin [Flavobacteriales bacterium]MCW8968276.1 OprO/OprP family phosphate-selective porin [Flavobacteriales bacterium]
MNSIKLILTFVVAFFLSVLGFSQEVTNGKFGKGIYNVIAADSSWSMKFGARFQTLYIGEWDVDDKGNFTDGSSNFLVRRARLKFDGFAYSPKLEYKLELGLSNRDMSGASQYTSNSPRYIFDALLKWNFYKNFVLWMGQTKLPGNRERVVSSANLQFVDRSMLNSAFNIDRDMGVQLRHHFKIGSTFLVREIVAFSQGEGRNITSGNLGGYQYTYRVEFLPFGAFSKKGDYTGGDLMREEEVKLSIAGSYDMNDNAVKTKSNLGSYMVNDIGLYETDIHTLFIDAMLKYKGFSLMAEYAQREADYPEAINDDGTLTGDIVNVGKGINLQMGYLFKSNWELSGRFTQIDYIKEITGNDVTSQYTLGLSKYLSGHKLKVQSDISYATSDNFTTGGLMSRLQIDIHF